MPDSEKNAYENINYFFTSVFTLELIFKIIGQSPKEFIMDKFNIFDSIIVLISLVELFFSSGSGGVSALRAFRLFRIFKLFRTGNLRVLLDSIAYTMGTIGNYVILLGLFIYVYALLGMQFFAGNLKFDEDGYYDSNGNVPRANFDTLYWAAITVFQVLIGDNWNQVMFNCELALGRVSAIYFISLILFGNIVMLNLFLAILLGNFDKARSYWLKKRIFEMFETAIKREYTLKQALTIILGDVSETVRDELLVHEPKDIFKLNGRLSIINRKLMLNDPEEEDKINYYDRTVQYQLDYMPIEEVARDNHSENPYSNSEMESGPSENFEINSRIEKSKSQINIGAKKKENMSNNERVKKKFTSFTPLSDKKMLLSVEKYKKANDDNSSENKDLMNSNREKDNNSLHFEGGDDKEKSYDKSSYSNKSSYDSKSKNSQSAEEFYPKIKLTHAVSDMSPENKDDNENLSPDDHAEELKNSQYLQTPNEVEHNEFDTNEDMEYVEVGSKKNAFKRI